MKRRGFFSLVLVFIIAYPVIASSPFLDIGSADGLIVIAAAFAEAETNSASSVTVITAEDIKAAHAVTTAELVGRAIGTTFASYGALGAAQSVQIRGASASKTLVYMDGVLLTSAQDGVFDLSSIPVSIIERIEIIKSGPGNLGKANAIGGIVHIITKTPEADHYPFSVTFENGSLLPVSYGADEERNWRSLVDSQRLGIIAQGNIAGLSIRNNLEGITARNAYVYRSGSSRNLRNNAGMYKLQDNLSISSEISDTLAYSSANLISFQHAGVPGSLIYGLTPDDYQEDIYVSTAHTLSVKDLIPSLENMDLRLHYAYGELFYHDAAYGDSTHQNHLGSFAFEQQWKSSERFVLHTGLNTHLSFLDSTDVGQRTRITPTIHANGSIYLADGRVSLHPAANISYLSDTEAFSPGGSVGVIYSMTDRDELKMNVSYAENAPSFNQLYWPFMSNPDLETEKGINIDVGYAHAHDRLTYEANVFFRNIHDAIINDSSWIPQNIARSLYLGTEQSVAWQINGFLKIAASYQYNKSFDLSDHQTIADNIEVGNIRKHTLKAALTLEKGTVSAIVDGEYLGKATNLSEVYVIDVTVNMQLREHLQAYVAIDNLLNSPFEFSSGYPMPGTKVRVGGTWDIR